MQEYKGYSIYVSAIPAQSTGWHAQGIVFNPRTTIPTELQRLEPNNILFPTNEEAEAYGLLVCKAWINFVTR
jgi:hypothetical protein